MPITIKNEELKQNNFDFDFVIKKDPQELLKVIFALSKTNRVFLFQGEIKEANKEGSEKAPAVLTCTYIDSEKETKLKLWEKNNLTQLDLNTPYLFIGIIKNRQWEDKWFVEHTLKAVCPIKK